MLGLASFHLWPWLSAISYLTGCRWDYKYYTWGCKYWAITAGDSNSMQPVSVTHQGSRKTGRDTRSMFEDERVNTHDKVCNHSLTCSSGPLPVIGTYNPIYRKYIPIYNQL